MADVQVALPVATPPTSLEAAEFQQPQPHPHPPQTHSVTMPSLNAVTIVVEDANNTPEPSEAATERPVAEAVVDAAQPTIEVSEDTTNDESPVEVVESAQVLVVPPQSEEVVVESSGVVVEEAPAATVEDTTPVADHLQVDSTVQEPLTDASAPEQSEENTEPVVVPDFEVDLIETFPFTEEEEIDVGVPYTGGFVVYSPEPEIILPFDGLEDEDLPLVIKGNFATFFQLKCGQEYYRNYIRGNTIRRLRTAPDAIKGKPSILNGFFQLPVEVLYDVLELAHPMDLLHLSRSSKALRAIILDKRAEHVWKNAYENHDDVPAPPKEISPPKWTSMMYGDAICDFCGQPGALLDFALEEHYCETCQKKYLVEQNDMLAVTDSYGPRLTSLLYQLLPATYRQSGGKYQTYYESFNNARYRRKDVEAMIETLQTWFMTIDEGLLPEAGEKFEAWSNELMNKVNAVSEYAANFNSWATTFFYTICTELSNKQRVIAEQCMKKFAKLGYDERDTDAASSDVYYYFRGVEVWRMSPKVMEQHKADMIEKIEAHKRERLKRDRREFVDDFYKKYRMTLKAEQWEHLPPPDVVAYDSIFLRFINQETLDTAEELKVDEATLRLPKLIDDWRYNRQNELYELLPGASTEQEDYVEPTEEGLTPEDLAKHAAEWHVQKRAELKTRMDARMKRATTIFTCSSCKNGRHGGLAVVGWDAACTHMCGSYPLFFHASWEFCSVGYAAAASLVRQLGLDPDTATIEEVDALDARFFCGNCPVKAHKKIQGRKAYTWRECVTHAVEKEEDHTHAIPAWLLLSEKAISFVKAHEIPHPSPRKSNWSCNICPVHIDGGVTLKAAQAHIKESHSIEKPETGVDVVFLKGRFERGGNGRRRPVFHYGIEPTCNLRCNLCRAGRVQRMWTIQALVPHLFHMHGISMPQSVRDYHKIEVLAAA